MSDYETHLMISSLLHKYRATLIAHTFMHVEHVRRATFYQIVVLNSIVQY